MSDETEDETELVTCEGHGQQPSAFVCQQLAESQPEDKPIGFHWNCEGGDLLANCNACEAHAGEDGFLPDDFFQENFVVICRSCFIEMAAVNGAASEAIAGAEAAAKRPNEE